MKWFGKSFIKFCQSFIKLNKAPLYTDMHCHAALPGFDQVALVLALVMLQIQGVTYHVRSCLGLGLCSPCAFASRIME